MREIDCFYNIEVEVSQVNEDGILKPASYQTLFAEIASRHLNSFHMNADHTMEFGMAWALISLQVEICRNIHGCEALKAQTWHSAIQGPYFRRELRFFDVNDELVFKGSTFSVLLDIEKRSIIRPKMLPIQLPDATPEFTIQAKPTKKISLDFDVCDERIAYPSYIDMLGHVNNCRYGEFAYDAFSAEEQKNLSNLKRMEIYFESELRKGDIFTIGKAYDIGDNATSDCDARGHASGSKNIYFRGYNVSNDKKSFDVVMTF